MKRMFRVARVVRAKKAVQWSVSLKVRELPRANCAAELPPSCA